MTKKPKMLTLILLITSMLLIQLFRISITVNAAASEQKSIQNITITLKPGIDEQPHNIFYIANKSLSNEDTLDIDDIILTATYTDNSTEIIDISSTKYNIQTNIEEIRSKAEADQELSATLTYNDSEGNKITVTSIDNPKVTILPAPYTIPSIIILKLKNEQKDTYYVADDILYKEDTLDIEDLEADVTLKTYTPSKDYYNIDNDDDKYEIKLETKTFSLPLDNEDNFTITTNVEKVRTKVANNQVISAKLTYAEEIKNETDKQQTNNITIESTNNPKVNIIKPTQKTKITGIKVKLKNKDKKYYVDNGLVDKNKTLNDSDIELFGIYETYYVTDFAQYDSFSKEEKALSLSSPDYKLTTNVETVRKLVGKKEITATLTYKDEYKNDILIQTIDNATVSEAKISDPDTTMEATTAKVNILPPLPIDGTVTITPQNFGADETDIISDKTAIQGALDLACDDYNLLVFFPEGKYYTGGNLFIHSNTTLKLDENATIIRNSNSDPGVPAGTTNRLGVNKNMFKIAPYNSTVANKQGGYDNGSNIIIEGGTFDGGKVSVSIDPTNLINLGHASDIIIRNATFKNCYGNHLIELVAVQNAEIYGCTFTGFRYINVDITDSTGKIVNHADPKGNVAEAVQIDVAHKTGKTAWTSTYLTDDTPCNNISIHDNTFNDYPVAIGNHHSLNKHHHNNITIFNNTITSTKKKNSGIRLYGCDNSSVTFNTVSNCTNGIVASASNNFIISNNKINNTTNGIKNIEASSGQIISNTITNPSSLGISVYGSDTFSSTIRDNHIKNSQKDGIIIYSDAVCENLTNNNISNCDGCGIKVYDNGEATTLTSNTINSCKVNGIEIYKFASVPTLSKNTIKSCKSNGIAIYGDASVSKLNDNSIKTCTANGIKIYESASIPTIENNTITSCQANGIEIYKSASVPTLIKNSIKNCKGTGIYLHSSAVSNTINNNKISNCNTYGICISEKASVKTLSYNTINKTKNNGIYIKNNKIKVKLKSNRLTKVAKNAIKIDSKFSKKKKQKYTFAPKVTDLNLAEGMINTHAAHLKKIKFKIGGKTYTRTTKTNDYTFYFNKNIKQSGSATITFTDKNKNTVTRVVNIK